MELWFRGEEGISKADRDRPRCFAAQFSDLNEVECFCSSSVHGLGNRQTDRLLNIHSRESWYLHVTLSELELLLPVPAAGTPTVVLPDYGESGLTVQQDQLNSIH